MKPTVESLELLFGAVVGELARRIADDEASAADIGNAIKLLKDNDITAVIEDNSAMTEMQDKLAAMRAKRGLRSVPKPDAAVTDEEAAAAVEHAVKLASGA